MWRIVRSRPSPAMIVALVALFIALGGSAVAVSLPGKNSVNSGDVKNNSIRGADIRNNSVTAGDIQLNTTVQSAGGILPHTTVRLTCQSGIAISGGVQVGDPSNQFITSSHPVQDTNPPTSWQISVGEIVEKQNVQLSSAYVVCLGL
jgi:hypothetical protein